MNMIVGTKLRLKLAIFIFWIKFTQKGYFRLKTKKSEHHHCALPKEVPEDI